MGIRLTRDLVDFVESGVSVLVGTRDAQLRPEAARATGAKVAPGGEHVSVFLSESMTVRAREHLREVPLIAVAFSRPFDNLAVQLKGPVIEMRPSTEAEQKLQEHYLAAYSEVLYYVGLPRSLTRRFRLFPSVTVSFEITDVFEQTPGPQAGRRHAVAGGEK